MSALLEHLDRALRGLRYRVRALTSRSVVRSVDPSKRMQVVQIERWKGDLLDGVEHFQAYGFRSVPDPAGQPEGVAISFGGVSDATVVVCTDDRSAGLTDLALGEVAVFDKAGKRIHLKANGDIVITGQGRVLIESDVEVTGDITATGTIQAGVDVKAVGNVIDDAGGDAKSLQDFRDVYNPHTHPPGNNPPSPLA